MAKVLVKGRDGKTYFVDESELDSTKHCINKEKCGCKPSKKNGCDTNDAGCGKGCGNKKNNCGPSKSYKDSSNIDDLYNNCPSDDDLDNMFNFDFGDLDKMFGPIDND